MDIIARIQGWWAARSTTLTVRIAQDHLDRGERGSAWSCPLALAVSEMFPNALEVRAGSMHLTVIFPDMAVRWEYTDALQLFIWAVDNQHDPKPSTFVLVNKEVRKFEGDELRIWSPR